MRPRGGRPLVTLLAPGALVGLLLLAIPIVVHLFKPRRVRQTPFSSLRWLHLTQQRMARRIQWHQVLLFLLRAAFLSLLVLALARPLYAPSGVAQSLDRIVVLDVSRSMGHRSEGRPRPIETARDLAAQLIQRMQPGDRAALLLAGAKTEALASWTSDAAPYLATLESLEPTPTTTNLDSSLPTIRSLLDQRRTEAAAEIYILTDNTSGSWTPGAIASFTADLPEMASVSFRLVDVGLPAPRNGWLASARLQETSAGPVLRVQAACVGADQPRTLRVSGLSGVEDLTSPVTLSADRPTTLDLPLPASFRRSLSRVRLSLEPADESPGDDNYFVDLDAAGAARLLLVEPEATPGSQSAGFPLRTAIQALADAGSGAADYRLSVRSPTDATATEIAAADIVLLADVPGLTSAQADALTDRVRQGAGAAFFLGPATQAELYNQRFTRPLKPAEGLLPAALGSAQQVPAARGGLAPWGHWDQRHPLVNGLLDPLLGDLASTQSRAYFHWREAPSGNDEVLASFDDGVAALIARPIGAGRVVWINASADDRWCDLPRRKSFVPLVDRLLTYLSGAGWRRTFDAGESISLQIPESDGERFVAQTPSGKTLVPRAEANESGSLLRFEGALEAGFYAVNVRPGEGNSAPPAAGGKGPASPLVFVVQPSRAESAMTPLDPETLRSWWAPASLELMKPSALKSSLGETDGRLALEPWLLLLAGAVLLAEMFLAHWLCPRINPVVAGSAVRRRGSVGPLRSREKAAP